MAQEYFFPGPGDFTLGEKSLLTVEFSHSNLLVPDRSTVTVIMNDRALRSIYLDQANVGGLNYTIPIPKELIRKDFNKLRLEYAMTLGLECEDPTNPALFSVVFATTQMQLVSYALVAGGAIFVLLTWTFCYQLRIFRWKR